MKQNMYSFVLGGFAFWAPFVLLAATGKFGSILPDNISSLAGIFIFGLISWYAARKLPKWGWVLAGVYVFGPTAMFTAAVLAHNLSKSSLDHWWVFVAICLLPPMTLWLSFVDGMIFSVMFVTLTLPLLSLARRTGQLRDSSSSGTY